MESIENELMFFQEKKQFITGYWENWSPGDPEIMTQNFNRVMYSFLTLDSQPNHHSPNITLWDGKSLYETMTLKDINDVLDIYNKYQDVFQNPNNWQKEKIVSLQNSVKENGGKFIWAIGG